MQYLKAGGVIGSILALIALLMIFIKQLIAFIGFLTFAIKAVIVLAFIGLFLGVGVLVIRSWKSRRRQSEKA